MKKLTAFILVLVLITLFTACSSTGQKKDNTQNKEELHEVVNWKGFLEELEIFADEYIQFLESDERYDISKALEYTQKFTAYGQERAEIYSILEESNPNELEEFNLEFDKIYDRLSEAVFGS